MTSLKQMKRRYMMSLWKNKNTGKEMANKSIKLLHMAHQDSPYLTLPSMVTAQHTGNGTFFSCDLFL
jgi:hypothetical protein